MQNTLITRITGETRKMVIHIYILRKILCGEDIFRVTVVYATANVRGFKVVSGESRAGSKRVCLMTCKVSGRKSARPDGHNIPVRRYMDTQD